MNKLLLTLVFLCGSLLSFTQELKVQVQVLAPNVANINRKNLDVLQKTIQEFLNNHKWTNETYLAQERIECMLLMTITSWDGNAAYTAETQIQSTRPVYGTSYYSPLLNMNDKDFDFTFLEGQTLDASDQQFISNLSSLLSFYAHFIIGLDKDSFSPLGGTFHFQKAQQLLNLAQNSGNKGWRAFEGLRNRYWLVENVLNKGFAGLRLFIYHYHRQGLDVMQKNPTDALQNILLQLPALQQQMDQQKIGSLFPNIFFGIKADELVKVLQKAAPLEKSKAMNLLSNVDPANTGKYQLLQLKQ